MNKLVAYAKLLRLPGIGVLGISTVIAALTVGVVDLVDLCIVFLIGAIACVFGFIVNDYTDVELDGLVDELKEKPLVSGVISKKAVLMISFFLIFISFLLITILWYGQTIDYYKFLALLCIFSAGILGSIYDLYGKKIIGSDFLVAISVALIFLFGALAFDKPEIVTWIIFVLTFNNLLYMNAIQNGIKDADHDSKMGVKNIALSSGVKVKDVNLTIPQAFKAFGMGIRLCSAVLLFSPFIFFHYTYYVWQIVLLTIFTVLFLFIDVKFLTMKTFDRNKIRKIIGIQSFLSYSLVPLMLIPIIGMRYSAILIIFPISWYVAFTPLIREKLFKPRM
jgi:4-hydroxybenzoate polyprenyltransferase